MPRIPLLDNGKTSKRARELIEEFEENEGMVTNLVQTLAHSPVALETMLRANETLSGGELDEKLRYRIALTVSELNESPYCLAAYVAYSRAAGISDHDILDARRGDSPDSRIDAALKFARKMTKDHSSISDSDIGRMHRAGYSDGEVLEVVSVVVMTIYANYVNNVAGTDIDFTPVPLLNKKV